VLVRQTISREQFSGDSVHTDYRTHILFGYIQDFLLVGTTKLYSVTLTIEACKVAREENWGGWHISPLDFWKNQNQKEEELYKILIGIIKII
jgi:hypothetical protein